MSSLLTKSAMLIVMLLHAGFGCCWHHDHAAHGGHAGSGHDSLVAACGHHHDHGSASHQHNAPDAPRPEADDCVGDCVFVTGGSPSVPGPDAFWTGADFLDRDAARLVSRTRGVSGWDWSRMRGEDVAPRAPRPLLCVWQI